MTESNHVHNSPFFSIIIPVYNKEKFIAQTLQSVKNQIFDDYEVIIIDDESTDGSLEVINTFLSDKIQCYSVQNQGVSNARNFGIQKSKANYIALLDADDCWSADYLQTIFETIGTFPDEKVFATALRFEVLDKEVSSVYSFRYDTEPQIVNYFKGSLKQSVLTSSSAVFHRTVFENTGGFNSKYQVGEDTDMWVRIGMYYPIVFIPKELVLYKFDVHGLSNNRKKYSQKADFEEYISYEKADKDLKKFLDYNRFSLALESKMDGNQKMFKRYYRQIDIQNLPFKKRVLLALPSFILKKLVYLKLKLAIWGLGDSVFK
ncbi:MAG: glycosyltransferase [Bacteroidota bacterium]|nr:glycosyltransferase [Bacteroidota bacterium]